MKADQGKISLSTSEIFALEECQGVLSDAEILPGFCAYCSSVEINDDVCNGCENCNDGLASYSIDCSNVSPELTQTCGSDDDSFLGNAILFFAGVL